MYYYYNKIPNLNKIELHYIFGDDSHSMDAVLRNSTERELLSIIEQISKELDIPINIESFAYAKGGLKEYFGIVVDKVKNNQFLSGIIAGIIISVLSHYATKDYEKEALEQEKLQLEIQKLKIELKEEKEDKTKEDIIQNAAFLFNNDIKIIKHRSNYYKKLNNYPKITKISTLVFDNNDKPTDLKSEVERKDFENFIIQSDELKPIMDDDAIIEIISPVLKKGRYKWKGVYLKNNEPISFYMKDTEFKQHVVSDAIPFQNGSQIRCELEIERKVNEIGEVENHSYSVLLVNEVINAENSITTEHSKRIKSERLASKQQLKLNFPNKEK